MLKIVEFSKVSIKIKNCKTFCKTQTASHLKKFIQSQPIHQPHLPDKTLLRLGNNFFIEIYRNIQTFAFKVLQLCSSWAYRNSVVQIFFLTLHRKMFAGKFVKSEGFWICFGSILFSMSNELRMSEVFLAKLYCKMCYLFC